MITRGRLVAGTLALLIVVSLPAQAVYADTPRPISGTLFKGPAVAGVQRFVSRNVLQIRDEVGHGTVTGGVLTGSAVYTFGEQMLNFAQQSGTLQGRVVITTASASTITLGLTGVFSGVTPGVETITITGTWMVLSVSGPDEGLRGQGQFTAVVIFEPGPQFGEAQGAFSGLIR
jgi:hypothetical protein